MSSVKGTGIRRILTVAELTGLLEFVYAACEKTPAPP